MQVEGPIPSNLGGAWCWSATNMTRAAIWSTPTMPSARPRATSTAATSLHAKLTATACPSISSTMAPTRTPVASTPGATTASTITRLQYQPRVTVVENSLGQKTTYHHRKGLVWKTVDALGAVTETERNQWNEVVKETDALGQATEYGARRTRQPRHRNIP